SADGTRLLVACEKGLLIWDYKSKQTEFHKTPGFCLVARFSPNGRYVANNFGKYLALWNGKSGEHMKTLAEHSTNINDIQFSRSGERLASCSSDGKVSVYDMENGCLQRARTFMNEQVLVVGFVREELLLVGTVDKVFVWDVKEDRVLHEYSHLFMVR